MTHNWHWWFGSDAGLLARVAIGCAIFVLLAVVDLARRGRKATRWREYLFLIAAVAVAMAYGFANDFIASSISWEYFYYGKGLSDRLGPGVQGPALRWEACKLGLKATWSAGLIIGVALLLANNPRRDRPQLPYQRLLRILGFVLLCTATGAAIGAWAGTQGWLTWTNPDLKLIAADGLFRPRRFQCVYGMNLGGYAGGAIGTVIAVIRIRRRRAQPVNVI